MVVAARLSRNSPKQTALDDRVTLVAMACLRGRREAATLSPQMASSCLGAREASGNAVILLPTTCVSTYAALSFSLLFARSPSVDSARRCRNSFAAVEFGLRRCASSRCWYYPPLPFGPVVLLVSASTDPQHVSTGRSSSLGAPSHRPCTCWLEATVCCICA